MTTPLVQIDFRLVQGDGWSAIFPLTFPLTGAEYPIPGYAASFSLRQNYGDAAPIFSMTTSVPSANGSTIAIVVPPSGALLSAVFPTAVPADTMLLVSLAGARQSKWYFNMAITPPGGSPITVAAGTWYAWARA